MVDRLYYRKEKELAIVPTCQYLYMQCIEVVLHIYNGNIHGSGTAGLDFSTAPSDTPAVEVVNDSDTV